MDDVAAVLQVWYPGEQFGAALAAVLFGDEEPAGRLPLTFPLDRADLPGGEHGPGDAPARLTYDEGVAIGYRSPMLRRSGALFPFGFGLGHSRTRHDVLDADIVDGAVRLRLRATNLDERPAVHVAQAYVELDGRDDGAGLAGIARIPLAACQSGDGEIRIPADAFLRYDASLGRRALVAGTHAVRVCVHALDPGERVTVEVDEAEGVVAAAAGT
jgi:beta-glucosidase